MDTNVLVSALRSRRGGAFRLLSQIGLGRFSLHLSVPLVLEYEDVLRRQFDAGMLPDFTWADLDRLLTFLCEQADWHRVFYLWRPYLPDPKDDMVLELAISAGCAAVVTFNQTDFRGAERFGIAVVTPTEFLRDQGEG